MLRAGRSARTPYLRKSAVGENIILEAGGVVHIARIDIRVVQSATSLAKMQAKPELLIGARSRAVDRDCAGYVDILVVEDRDISEVHVGHRGGTYQCGNGVVEWG